MSTMNMSVVKIGNYTEGHLLKQAEKIVKAKSTETPVFDQAAEDRLPKFDTDELTIGKVLGHGGFCTVREVVKVSLKDGIAASKSLGNAEPSHWAENQKRDLSQVLQDRNFMESFYLRNDKEYRYAIKRLKDDAHKDVQTFINGIVDLALEARFLAVVRHPNIIKMRALYSGSPYSRDFFLVLDRLYDILSRTLGSWKKQKMGGVQKLMDRGGKKAAAFWVKRVSVAHDLACALKYLHGLNIIYRDLKPDNIGFDVRGDVKIFDFGLSRQLPPSESAVSSNSVTNPTFKMTGDTGSPRYMAPEVALGQPYNASCDVYSFTILLHQILSLDLPYEGYTMSMFQNKVVKGGHRPRLDPKWSDRITSLMCKGWSVKLSERPGMDEIVEILRAEVSEFSTESVQEMLDTSGRTQHSLHLNQGRKKG